MVVMSVAEFLADLRGREMKVWAEGDRLRCSAPAGVLTAEVREELRRRKADILAFLRAADELTRQQPAIVPLQAGGDRIPLFAVPGHNGNVFSFRAFALEVGADQPFFGLQPPGVDGQGEPLERVEDLAAYFAAQIREFRPQGPYGIAGHCSGGTIAFELARQLLEQGVTVSVVALFASPYPTWFRAGPKLRRRVAHKWGRVVHHANALRRLSFREQRAYLRVRLRNQRRRREDPAPAAPDSAREVRTRLERVTMAAVRNHTPGHLRGRLCLFLPSRDCRRPSSGMLRWRSQADDSEEYIGPDGCRGDKMLLEPWAPVTADLFRRCRDGAPR